MLSIGASPFHQLVEIAIHFLGKKEFLIFLKGTRGSIFIREQFINEVMSLQLIQKRPPSPLMLFCIHGTAGHGTEPPDKKCPFTPSSNAFWIFCCSILLITFKPDVLFKKINIVKMRNLIVTSTWKKW